MQVQFLIDQKTAGAEPSVVGWTVLKPGAAHERHLHRNCDEFFYRPQGQRPCVCGRPRRGGEKEDDVVYSPRDCPHGFKNTSDEDVVLVWGWNGSGSLEASGYEVVPNGD